MRDKLAKWGVSEMLAVSNKCSCMDAFLGGLSIFVPERESPKEKRSGKRRGDEVKRILGTVSALQLSSDDTKNTSYFLL